MSDQASNAGLLLPEPSARGRGQRRSEQVTARLLDAISAGQWRPGDRLPPEDELAAQLGLGRSSVREGIKALERSGVVVIRRGGGGGTYVAAPNYRQLGDALGTMFQMRGFDSSALYEARRFIEPGIAACAALHASPEDVSELAYIVDQVEMGLRAGENVAGLHNQWHFALARATHNPLMLVL